MQAIHINSEEELVALAIKLDQRPDAQSRARARALRNVAVPLFNHLNKEQGHHWKSEEEFVASISTLSEVLGTVIFGLSNMIGEKEKRVEFAAHFIESILSNIAVAQIVQGDIEKSSTTEKH